MTPSNVTCPVCKKAEAETGSKFFPFCSERCKMADLGHWMSGSYKISRSLHPQDLDSFDPEMMDPNQLDGGLDLPPE